MHLLETNICIHLLNHADPQMEAEFRRRSPREIALCSVVKAELLYGARTALVISASVVGVCATVGVASLHHEGSEIQRPPDDLRNRRRLARRHRARALRHRPDRRAGGRPLRGRHRPGPRGRRVETQHAPGGRAGVAEVSESGLRVQRGADDERRERRGEGR